MKFIKESYKVIKNALSSNLVLVYFIVGLLFLVASFVYFNEVKIINKLLYTVGTTLIAGGVFASIAKSSQFTDIFSKILRDIIYANEHLEVRKDLENIWENVTLTLTNRKFLKISDKMKDNIKKYYLPLNHDYYYDNFNIETVIEIDTNNPDYLVFKETCTFDIICEDDNLEIKLCPSRGMKFDYSNKKLTNYKLEEYYINDNLHKPQVHENVEKNRMWFNYEVKLKGAKKYSIRRKEVIRYNIKYDQIKKHVAMWVYNGIKIDILYPNDLYIDFHSVGTLDNFVTTHNKNSSFQQVKARYNGLIYKNQGFLVHMCKKI